MKQNIWQKSHVKLLKMAATAFKRHLNDENIKIEYQKIM